jgi:hypothetical protein
MNQNSYARSLELGLDGSNAEKVAVLRTLTHRPILLADLTRVLNFRKMLQKTDGAGGGERWKGSIINMKAALVAASIVSDDADQAQRAAAATAAAWVDEIDTWFSHVTNPRSDTWDTTDPKFAMPFAAMRDQFADSEIFNQGDFDAVYDLGGGLRWPLLDVTSFLQHKNDFETEVARGELRDVIPLLRMIFDAKGNELIHQINSGVVTTVQQIRETMSTAMQS